MNTTAWLISFTDSSGKQVQTVHMHNCIADFRLLDPNAAVQEIDCAAVAELIEAAKDVIDSTVTAHGYPDGPCIDRTERERLIAALSNIGPQS